jgi:hypothetical protein
MIAAMRTTAFLMIALTFSLLSCGEDTPTNDRSAAALTVSEPTFDFGNVPQYSELHHRFCLRSTGTGTVRLNELTSSPLLEIEVPADSQIAPGDSLPLEVVFGTGAYTGTMLQRASVFANTDPEETRLFVQMTIVEDPDSTWPIVPTPYRLQIVRIGNDSTVAYKVALNNRSDSQVTLVPAEMPREVEQVALPATIPPGATDTLTLILAPSALSEPFRTSCTIDCLIADTSGRITIPIVQQISP